VLRILIALFVVQITIAISVAQTPIKCPGALTEKQLADLIKGEVPESRVKQYIEICNIGFTLTPEVERRLRALGGSALIIDLVKKKQPAAAKSSPVELKLKMEQALWNTIKDSNDPVVLKDFMRQFPSGLFAAAAQSRIRALEVSRLKIQIRNLLDSRSWDKASQKISELTLLSPDDADAIEWQRLIAIEISAQRQVAEFSSLKTQVRGFIDAHNWKSANEKIDELIRLSPNDADIISWRKLIAKEIEENEWWAKQPPISINTIGMEFSTILAGKFMMGCSFGDQLCNNNENPRHEVMISRSFQMGRFKVTQGQWAKIMGTIPSCFKGDDRLPVTNVSWNDAQAFIARLNALRDGYRYRLPTEAEWEYAARAGTAGSLYGKLNEIVQDLQTQPVGHRKANSFGLYDTISDLFEWCDDWYEGNYYGSSPSADPKGPAMGETKVFRGGSWDSAQPEGASVSRRGPGGANERFCNVGIRLCRERF
jgi:formylglycine-generating enzyme required for sulfatase activity